METTEPRWPSAAAVVLVVALDLLLPRAAGAGAAFRIGVPLLQLCLLAPLVVTTPHRRGDEPPLHRRATTLLTAVLSTANAVALVLLVRHLVHGTIGGGALLRAAGCLWAANVVAFALWYWELDGGGPPARLRDADVARDFAFPQMTDTRLAGDGWRPSFVDYLYLSFTNGSAFSAADTVPLTPKAKLLMLLQATISIVVLVLVAARAVNMLG
jgi:uncharacterized membrane protein